MSQRNTNALGQKLNTSRLALPAQIFGLVILGAVLLVIVATRRPPEGQRLICGTNLSALAKAIIVYAGGGQGRCPPADKWCDLLIRLDYAPPGQFVCDKSGAVEGESSFALNKNLAGRNLAQVPPDMVLLFETNFGQSPGGRQEPFQNRDCYSFLSQHDYHWPKKYPPLKKVYKLRWNQCGGPEILTTENHKNEGCNVAFVDSRVRFVKTEELGTLKWKVEDANSLE